MRAQTDNREDGSCWITITSLDNEQKATFYASLSKNVRNRNKVRFLSTRRCMAVIDEDDGEVDGYGLFSGNGQD